MIVRIGCLAWCAWWPCGGGFMSCSKDDDGWWDVKQELAGEWETEAWDGVMETEVVQYRATIQSVTEKSSALPYAIYGICKNGKEVVKEQGIICHPNDEADNVFEFRDYHNSRARTVTISWLDNTHTSLVLYDGKVFRKK